jgi:PadR family transcriptional regulator PadR
MLAPMPRRLGTIHGAAGMTKERNTLLHGTLEALILKTLSHGPRHGYAIARWLEERTDQALQVEEGSLYPALYRMEARGLLRAEWGRSELDRRAKFYHLTEAGETRLLDEVEAWARFSTAVSAVLLA